MHIVAVPSSSAAMSQPRKLRELPVKEQPNLNLALKWFVNDLIWVGEPAIKKRRQLSRPTMLSDSLPLFCKNVAQPHERVKAHIFLVAIPR